MTRRDFVFRALLAFVLTGCSKDDNEEWEKPNPPANCKIVCLGAKLCCSRGLAYSNLMVVDPMRPLYNGTLQANVMDNVPMVNIMPFGLCQSMSNPAVAAATAAAMGVLTPQPCQPAIAAPWSPGGSELIANKPALMDNAKLMCNWNGQISIEDPGSLPEIS